MISIYSRARLILRCGLLKKVAKANWNTTMYRALSVSSGRGGKKDDINLSSLFKPVSVSVKATPDDINIGAELTGSIDKTELIKLLNKFTQKKEIRTLCLENGLDCKS